MHAATPAASTAIALALALALAPGVVVIVIVIDDDHEVVPVRPSVPQRSQRPEHRAVAGRIPVRQHFQVGVAFRLFDERAAGGDVGSGRNVALDVRVRVVRFRVWHPREEAVRDHDRF